LEELLGYSLEATVQRSWHGPNKGGVSVAVLWINSSSQRSLSLDACGGVVLAQSEGHPPLWGGPGVVEKGLGHHPQIYGDPCGVCFVAGRIMLTLIAIEPKEVAESGLDWAKVAQAWCRLRIERVAAPNVRDERNPKVDLGRLMKVVKVSVSLDARPSVRHMNPKRRLSLVNKVLPPMLLGIYSLCHVNHHKAPDAIVEPLPEAGVAAYIQSTLPALGERIVSTQGMALGILPFWKDVNPAETARHTPSTLQSLALQQQGLAYKSSEFLGEGGWPANAMASHSRRQGGSPEAGLEGDRGAPALLIAFIELWARSFLLLGGQLAILVVAAVLCPLLSSKLTEAILGGRKP